VLFDQAMLLADVSSVACVILGSLELLFHTSSLWTLLLFGSSFFYVAWFNPLQIIKQDNTVDISSTEELLCFKIPALIRFVIKSSRRQDLQISFYCSSFISISSVRRMSFVLATIS